MADVLMALSLASAETIAFMVQYQQEVSATPVQYCSACIRRPKPYVPSLIEMLLDDGTATMEDLGTAVTLFHILQRIRKTEP